MALNILKGSVKSLRNIKKVNPSIFRLGLLGVNQLEKHQVAKFKNFATFLRPGSLEHRLFRRPIDSYQRWASIERSMPPEPKIYNIPIRKNQNRKEKIKIGTNCEQKLTLSS